MTVTCLSQVALDFVGPGSDKVYVIQVQQHSTASGTEYVAMSYYGKRSSPTSTFELYRGPSHAAASAAASRKEKSKRSGGYQTLATTAGVPVSGMPSSAPVPGAAGVTSSTAPTRPTAPVVSGPVPMRAEVLDEADLEKYLTDSNWAMQRKYDGERSPVSIRRGGITASNLKGTARTLASSSEAELKKLVAMPDFSDERETLVDGEELPGGVYVIYDVLTLRDNDMRKFAFEQRFAALEVMLETHLGLLAPTAFTTEEKRSMLAQAHAENWEGVMFRDVSGTYVHGRTSVILKFKLWDSCTCRVLTANTKRSIQVAVLDENNDEVFIGNVSVPVNMDIPDPDDLVEVRYLYVHDGGSLYQPSLLGVRKDKDEADLRSSLRPAPPEKTVGAIPHASDSMLAAA